MSDACCASEPPAKPQEPQKLLEIREIQCALGSGLALALGLVQAAWGSGTLGLAFFAIAIVVGGYTFVPEAIKNLPKGKLGVGTLMMLAGAGAIILGEWGEAATLAFLFSISEALESYALTKTRAGLRALLKLVPKRVTVLRGGSEVEVQPEELLVGDRIAVKPGESVATDAVVTNGTSAMDFSAITGESMPVEIGPGDEVFAAAINGTNALELEVTATATDNSLTRIVHAVEEAQDRKGQKQRLAERIAKPLVPGVLVLAILVGVIGSLLGDPQTWIERSLVILVAAAPCAFAISVPVTVVASIGAATRSGVLVKGGAALEALGEVRTVAFDKTGTLTRNAASVIAVVPIAGFDREGILRDAGALEKRSDHPLAQAIVSVAGEVPAADDVEAIAGDGIQGRLEGRRLRLGRPGYIETGSLGDQVIEYQDLGATVVLLEVDGSPRGLVAVRDEPRAEAAEAISQLRTDGLRTAMLTGDNRRTADAVASQVGIGEAISELRPLQKLEAVKRLQAEAPTAMVGDGINDAPALATADVGIAMGAMGTDVAIEASDVALMGDDLRKLPQVIEHARRSGRIMKQNLALSGLIILVLLPAAATGLLGLASVVAAHEIAELLVILNGVRAGRNKAKGPSDRSPAAPIPSGTLSTAS